MKKVLNDRIINMPWTEIFDSKFNFNYLENNYKNGEIEVFDMWILLKQRENTELLNSLWDRYSMYCNVYSEKDEYEIFLELVEYATKNNKKIHINWITLKKEIEFLEEYYSNMWYKREDVNCFIVDFSKVLVSVWVNIENLIWKWSDYKKYKKDIFFLPPVREAGLTKAMFKWINKWVVCNINIKNLDNYGQKFLSECLNSESILALTLAKVLYFNPLNRWFSGNIKELIIDIQEVWVWETSNYIEK